MSELPHSEPDFELLDSYLARLHAGGRPEREEMLRRHPGLASAIRCLEALENLAPEAVGGSEGDSPIFAARKSGQSPEDPHATPHTQETVMITGSFPRNFGRYELLGEIGRGGMGVVYKARQTELDRTVALKMILASHLASPDQVRRFQTEARSAAKLRHSHIVHIHEVGQLHGQDFFTMEYVEGESLAERIARGNVQKSGATGGLSTRGDGTAGQASSGTRAERIAQGPIEQTAAVRIVAAVARAVEYLHRQGIVHRDLKPSNILLEADDTPYLTDFGLAKVFSGSTERTATGVIAGTPSYMAPEQASGRSRHVGPAVDVYSLGAILYELLTGRPPFFEENPLDTLLGVLGGDPALPRQLNPKVPRALERICLKCLQKTPEERYPSAEALADDLERFLRGEPLAVRSPSLGQQFWAWTRRQPALALRLTGLSLFWIVSWFHFYFGLIKAQFHFRISVLLVSWMLISFFCQKILERGRWTIPARFLWGTLDSLLLLLILLVGEGVMSAMIIGYPLLIVASALWFRVRFVWFMTGLSIVSYGVLLMDFYYRRPELQTQRFSGWDRHVVFALGLVILAVVVSYLVQRVRTLSSFYGQKLP